MDLVLIGLVLGYILKYLFSQNTNICDPFFGQVYFCLMYKFPFPVAETMSLMEISSSISQNYTNLYIHHGTLSGENDTPYLHIWTKPKKGSMDIGDGLPGMLSEVHILRLFLVASWYGIFVTKGLDRLDDIRVQVRKIVSITVNVS